MKNQVSKSKIVNVPFDSIWPLIYAKTAETVRMGLMGPGMSNNQYETLVCSCLNLTVYHI